MGMDLNDLLRMLGQAANTQSANTQSAPQGSGGGDPLMDMLGGLLGSQSQPAPVETPKASRSKSKSKGQVLGSTNREDTNPQQQQSSGGLADILGSILGGGAPQQQQQQQPMGTGGLGDLLGGLLGGGATSRGGMGGRNPILAPLSNLVVEKTGLPPAIAELAVTFAVTQILNSMTGQSPSGQQGLGHRHLAKQLSTGDGVDSSYLSSSGLAKQFAEQSGLDLSTATNALEQTYGLISPVMAGGGLPTADTTLSSPAPSSSSAKKKTSTKSGRSKAK